MAKKVFTHEELEELWNEYSLQTGISLSRFKRMVAYILTKKGS